MGRIISEENKVREGRGTGEKADYKPWIEIREVNSVGLASSFPGWKHGRMVELLSQGQLDYYLLLRWIDFVEDIREQFPLDIEITNSIARTLGIRPYCNGRKSMVTDFLITLADGNLVACSIRNSRETFRSEKRKTEFQLIEFNYWKMKGIPWKVLFMEDVNRIETENIKDLVSYYRAKTVPDEIGLVKYMLSHKLIRVDLSNHIDYKQLIKDLKKEEIWKTYSYMLA